MCVNTVNTDLGPRLQEVDRHAACGAGDTRAGSSRSRGVKELLLGLLLLLL